MPTKMPSIIVVTRFIELNRLPFELATGILKNEDDCEEFSSYFQQTNKRLTDDLLDYREHKIHHANVTVAEFTERCGNCNGMLRELFEEVFVQAFSDSDMSIILTAVLNEKTSFEELFRQFVDNPNKNILKYVI